MKLPLILAAMFIFGQGTRPATVEVQGRILVEPAYPSPFPLELTLVFESVAGNSVSQIAVGEHFKSTSFSEVRGGMTGQSQLQKDGRFLVLLPRSLKEAALIVRLRPNVPTSSTNNAGYFLKSIQAGGVNLLEKNFVVGVPSTSEILLTLEKCTDRTLAQCR